ncbi:MAG: DUF4398 domain-containing protein [Methylobacter sp.]
MFTAKMLLRLGPSTILTSLLLVGCASEPPKDLMAQAEVAIQNAERSGAAQYEPGLLSSARTKLDRAHKQVDENENEDAGRLAEEALVEANLANAKTDAAKEAQQTDEMKKAIEALKQETSRESEGQ